VRARSCRLVLAAVAGVVAAATLGGGLAEAAQAAPWCGTPSVEDRAPAVTGRTIRVLYVVPSDGPDRTVELAPRISADVDEIAAWWRTQDPEREPRFDRASFPCGPQADILTLRVSWPAAALSAPSARFDRIADAVEAVAGRTGFEKQLVYYDGPTDDADICGEGAGTADGAGVAVVYLAACTDVPSAAVAAHELLHAFGALARGGPPHACPDTRGHPCDSTDDVLYPTSDGSPLASLVLDVGHDDYYAHAGAWLDVQDSLWLRLVTRQVPLSLSVSGRGSVQSDLPGLRCAAACRTEWDQGTSVALEALPGAGQRFVRWSGACSGSLRCTLPLAAATSVGALFAPESYGVVVSIAGRGAVAGAGETCRLPRCLRRATSYVPLKLRATAATGWRFAGWAGACSSRGAVCTVPMRRATSVRARFVKR
jgi:Divergent InlB B-repeat domain